MTVIVRAPRPFDLPSSGDGSLIPDIPGLPIPEERIADVTTFSERRYVGYRIEKQRYNSITGEWIPSEDIFVEELLQNTFNDTRIAYNQYYRYRAYSILRIIKDGILRDDTEYAELIDRVVDLAPETEDVLSVYGTIYNAYWIESFPSPWKYIKIVDKKHPRPPEDVQIYPKSDRPSVICTWGLPINEQKDIVKYYLFRKSIGSLKWDRIFVGGVRDNLFEDTDVVPNHRYVYAVMCEDVHTLRSKLSAQWIVHINANIKEEREENSIELYQSKGETVEKNDSGEYVTAHVRITHDTFGKDIVVHHGIRIIPDVTFPSYDRDFIIKVTSLDTDESQEVVLHMRKDALPVMEEPVEDEDLRVVMESSPVE